MDRTRGRRPPTFKSQTSIAPKATEEDYKPAVEWTEDQSNRIIIVHLPGFKREEIRVQLDNAGKLLIKGVKQVSNKYISVDLSLDVPDDTIGEKISGIFEVERLTLTMPKRVVKGQEATEKEKARSEGKGKESIQNERPNNAEATKEEEAAQKEAKTDEDKKHEPAQEKSATTEALQDELNQKEKPKINDDSKQETIQDTNSQPEGKKKKEKPKINDDSKQETIQDTNSQPEGKKKDDGSICEQKSEGGEEKKDEPVEKLESMEEKKKDEPVEKLEGIEEKKKEDPLQAMLKAVGGGKEEKNIQKMKSKIKKICADKPKEIIKRISTWKDAEDSYGSMDGILEKMNRNRKVIATAVVAFSIGFYVSHKLRTSGR